MRQVLIAFCAVLSLAACTSKAPIQSSVTPQLRIEARVHDGSYALFLPDASKPASDDELKQALDTYAELVDERAGLLGRDKYYYRSHNRVVYRAPLDAPAALAAHLLELCSSVYFSDVQVEALRPNGDCLITRLDMLRDSEGPTPRVTHAYRVKLTRDEKMFTYSVGLSPGTPTLVQDSRHAADTFAGGPWNQDGYTVLRQRVTAALLAIEIPRDSYIPDLGVRFPAEGDTPWIEVFLLVDAVRKMQESSGRELGVYVYPFDQNTPEPDWELTEPE